MDVLLDARLGIRGLGIGTFLDRLADSLARDPSVHVTLWRGSGGWSRRGQLSTLGHSGLFDISPRLDPRVRPADVVHFACNFGALVPGPHTVVTVHDLMLRPARLQDRILRFFLERCLSRAGAVVAVSEQTRNDLEAEFPWLTGRVTVIPHGMRHLPARTGPRKHVLAFGGGSDPRKRVPLAVAAYRAYLASSPDALPLVVLSRAGLLDDQERELLALGARLVPSATADEVDELVGEAAAVLYPTTEEGFGLPILEAAEAGTPVVIDAAARVPQELVGSHCVKVADAGPEAWADGIRRAVALGPVPDALSLPDWSGVASSYARLYREVAP